MAQEPPLKPGDEAAPDTPGTGEDLCPRATVRARQMASNAPYAAAPAR